ncbi:MAG: peptidoglycan DD-metalloendopeptidase family protein [Pseudomonadota bacterium]
MFALLLALPLAGLSAAAPAAEDEARTAARLQDILTEINALDEWFGSADKQEAQLQSQLRDADRQIAGVNKEVSDIVAALAELEAQMTTLRARQAELQREKQVQARRISEHIAAAYRLTGQDFLKQLLNQENPDEFQRMIRYHRLFSESRLAVLKDYQVTLAELAATDAEIVVQQATQQERREKLEARRSQLNGDRDNRLELIAQLESERSSKQSRYDALLADRNRLQELLTELRRRSVELDGTSFVAAKGNMPMPVGGRVRHAFGSRRADGRLRWQGIEIAAAHGTPVQAVFAGQVVFADWLRGFGFMTIIDHGGEYMTLYGNADALLKQVGDFVESGEAIATTGNSGGRPEPGIYFELRHHGEPRDPIAWVTR